MATGSHIPRPRPIHHIAVHLVPLCHYWFFQGGCEVTLAVPQISHYLVGRMTFAKTPLREGNDESFPGAIRGGKNDQLCELATKDHPRD